MTKETSTYLCQEVAPKLITKDTNYQMAISLKIKVAKAITRSNYDSPLYIIVDSFRINVSTMQEVVLEFYHALKESFI